MKTRTGFVSNSSSSSFLIISKGELNEEKLKQALNDKAENFAKCTRYSKDQFFKHILSSIEEEDYASFGCGISVPICDLNKDVYIYTGGHSDEFDGIDAELCCTNLSVDTYGIKIIWKPR